MFFHVVEDPGYYYKNIPNTVSLRQNSWNDFRYLTLFRLSYVDAQGTYHKIGDVKIGRTGMDNSFSAGEESKYRTVFAASDFDQLDENYFSLGQDESYYVNLRKLGDDVAEKILRGLRDAAFDEAVLLLAATQDVFGTSLLRSVSWESVEGRFRELSRGNDFKLEYSFRFNKPYLEGDEVTAVQQLFFDVDSTAYPPTNVHVLIGKNGVGKSTLLDSMANALIDGNEPRSENPHFVISSDSSKRFASVGFMSFSAFDQFVPREERRNKMNYIDYFYIGIKRIEKAESSDSTFIPKTITEFSQEFVDSCNNCLRLSKERRLLKYVGQLVKIDQGFEPIFRMLSPVENADGVVEITVDEDALFRLFYELSAGHKIVLLSLVQLVENLEDRTIVFIDEPESHLHAPLLSGYIRALSELLTEMNGVAVIATHSPVVLQEVPSSCVWRIRKRIAERLDYQTFGENVGILTNRVFGLDVEEAGYFKLLKSEAEAGKDFDQIMSDFNGQLGAEAQALLRVLTPRRTRRDKA